MLFRKARLADLSSIMEVFDDARKALANDGVDQWQNGYPTQERIEQDIEDGNLYVMYHDHRIVGCAGFSLDKEPLYDKIYDGSWRFNRPYATIHRFAIRSEFKGTNCAYLLMDHLTEIAIIRGIPCIRIDTHKDNKRMRRFLEKNHFVHVGSINLEDGAHRVCYETMIDYFM